MITTLGSLIPLLFVITISIQKSFNDYLAILIFLLSLSVIIPICIAYKKIRDEKNKFILLDKSAVYEDNDQYWRHGIYTNPNDNKILIEKRVGIGMTLNMAKISAKIIVGLIVALVMAGIIMVISMFPLDFGTLEIVVTDETLEIRGPMDNISIPTNNIIEVELLDTFPHATKTNGANGKKFLVGSFHVSNYGKSQVIIHRNELPVIAVKLENEWIFFNGSSILETESYFNLLK